MSIVERHYNYARPAAPVGYHYEDEGGNASETPLFDDEGFCTNWVSSPGRMIWRAVLPDYEAKSLMQQYGFAEFTDRL